ncbi:MAG: type II toxin-antitoxin system RelE/ParE family toxin [Alphaproteobacteria bacterium]|nr:type II toxin-antitoxin system RelE/ParE family toxin [Alphaproteobacteria bacterium]
MTRRYRLSREAEGDIARLYRFGVKTFGLAQADAYFDGLFERLHQIAETPQRYPSLDEIRAGYRRSVFAAHSIYFRLSPDGVVEIMRVLGREDTDAL